MQPELIGIPSPSSRGCDSIINLILTVNSVLIRPVSLFHLDRPHMRQTKACSAKLCSAVLHCFDPAVKNGLEARQAISVARFSASRDKGKSPCRLPDDGGRWTSPCKISSSTRRRSPRTVGARSQITTRKQASCSISPPRNWQTAWPSWSAARTLRWNCTAPQARPPVRRRDQRKVGSLTRVESDMRYVRAGRRTFSPSTAQRAARAPID